jgi:DNA-binding XRE family transcriptional regulator
MNDSGAKTEGSQPLTGRRAALADIAERRRKNPNWNSKTDPTYVGPYPTFVELMSNAEFDRHMAGVVERLHLASNPYERRAVEQTEPQPTPRKLTRAALPFGQRIRDLRRVLGWSQREVAWQLGVSARSIIRYEHGQSSPLRSAPLQALRRLESAYPLELCSYDVIARREPA